VLDADGVSIGASGLQGDQASARSRGARTRRREVMTHLELELALLADVALLVLDLL